MMRKSVLAALVLVLTLGGCGTVRESRFNPFNWFGQREAPAAQPVEGGGAYAPRPDPRPLVDQVTGVAVEGIPGGAILRATGLPPTQGFWAADLVRYEGTDVPAGVLVYDFRIVPPPYATRTGTEPSRRIEAATYLTDNDLNGIVRIVVRGARSQGEARP